MCDDKRRCGFTVLVRSWTSVESRHHNEGSISAEKRDIIFQRCSCFVHDITIDSPSLGPGHYLSLVCGAGGVGSEKDRVVFRVAEWDQS